MRIGTLIFCFICLPFFSRAQTYPAGFSQVLVADGIAAPTVMAFAPDSRLFVARQSGVLLIVKEGVLLTTPALQLTVDPRGERGLIGIAFDPDFESNGYLYLYYTTSIPNVHVHNRISRFTMYGDTADIASEKIILELDRLSSAQNHNGGAMAFGPDGKLYVAIGDNDRDTNAPNLDIYHGKVLRIERDGSAPIDNPFYADSVSEQRKRIWSYGLRNPFTLSFHPITGRLFVNDVGQSAREEVNDATNGGNNFGWPASEGYTTNPNYTSPRYAYSHGTADGQGCAITGGTFFSPSSTNYPSQYYGKYFIQDFCTRWINVINVSGYPGIRSSFATNIPASALSINVGPDGNLYFLSRVDGAIYKIVYNNSSVPLIVGQPKDANVLQYQPVVFTVGAIGSLPLSYQWQKNNIDIDGAVSSTYKINESALSDDGTYRVIVSNDVGKDTSNTVQLNVTHVNSVPIAQITLPLQSTSYVAGTGIDFSGAATDVDDGELGPGSFSWQINFHHDTHVHDQPAIEDVKSGVFDVPNEGETAANVWYRFILTVTDSEGAQDKDSVDVVPETSMISLETNPPGFQLNFDGQTVIPPFSTESVEGMLRSVDAPSPQIVNDVPYEFISWSNGGDATQIFATPHDDITLTAIFSVIVGIENDQATSDVILLSNPVRGEKINLAIKTDHNDQVLIKITDARAYQVLVTSQILHSGENNIAIDAVNLKAGLYFVSVETMKGHVVKKVLVLK